MVLRDQVNVNVTAHFFQNQLSLSNTEIVLVNILTEVSIFLFLYHVFGLPFRETTKQSQYWIIKAKYIVRNARGGSCHPNLMGNLPSCSHMSQRYQRAVNGLLWSVTGHARGMRCRAHERCASWEKCGPEISTVNVLESVARITYTGVALQTGYNHFHNILRHFNVFSNFPFTTCEKRRDYY